MARLGLLSGFDGAEMEEVDSGSGRNMVVPRAFATVASCDLDRRLGRAGPR
jgi:hypothetical protein